MDRLLPAGSLKEASEILGMTHQGAANKVHRLEYAGILREVTGQKRNQVFIADEILGFVHESAGLEGGERRPG